MRPNRPIIAAARIAATQYMVTVRASAEVGSRSVRVRGAAVLAPNELFLFHERETTRAGSPSSSNTISPCST